MQTSPVSSTNIAAAAITTQLGLIAIVSVGAAVLRLGDGRGPWRSGNEASRLAWAILPLTLFTTIPLIFSTDYLDVWRPLFPDAYVPALSLRDAMSVMFFGDIALVAVLVGMTGGSKASPFAPVYFVLPALALFLRDPGVVAYTLLIGLVFLWQLAGAWVPPNRTNDDFVRAEVMSYAIVSVLCMVLSVVIGWVTRPR